MGREREEGREREGEGGRKGEREGGGERKDIGSEGSRRGREREDGRGGNGEREEERREEGGRRLYFILFPTPPHNTPTAQCCTWYKHSLSCNSKRSSLSNIIHTHKSCTKCLSPRLTHVGAMNMYTQHHINSYIYSTNPGYTNLSGVKIQLTPPGC